MYSYRCTVTLEFRREELRWSLKCKWCCMLLLCRGNSTWVTEYKQQTAPHLGEILHEFLILFLLFLTAILHRGLRNNFFFHFNQFTSSNFCLDFYFPLLFGLLFLFLWTFIPFSFWNFIFVLFPFYFPFPFFIWTFIQSRSHFGFLPNFHSFLSFEFEFSLKIWIFACIHFCLSFL